MVTTRPIFLKLGGSLITDKRATEVVRHDVLNRLAGEIAEAHRANPTLPLVIGHGSGSFGHVHASRYGTREGVSNTEGWLGFARTGDAAARLNRIVTAALLEAGVPAWSLQPGAMVRARDGTIAHGLADSVIGALVHGLVPVLFGDVILDDRRGGTIASTEEVFEWLLPVLQPQRIVLAGEVDGIFSADPLLDPSATRIPLLTPATVADIQAGLGGSYGVDVTGGMVAKVAQAVQMVASLLGLEVVICSGLKAGQIATALRAPEATIGTRIARL